MITKDQVEAAVLRSPGRYIAKNGEAYRGQSLGYLLEGLREMGYRNVSRLDMDDFRNMGCTVITAQFQKASGKLARPCQIVSIGRC